MGQNEMSSSSLPPPQRDLRVAVVYRVLQAWRLPVFQKLASTPGIELHVFHGEEYPDSKLKNAAVPLGLQTTQLKTIRFTIRTRNGTARIPIQFGLTRALKQFNPDVVITEGASHIFGNIAAFFFCKRYGKALIQWGLGQLQDRKPSKGRMIADALGFRAIERHSTAAIAYSHRGADYYTRIGMPTERVFVAVNTVDTEARIAAMKEYCAESGMPYPAPAPKQFRVIFIGALTEGKKVDLLLEAFASFQKSYPDASLQILGDGDARPHLEGLAAESGAA